MIEFLKRNKNYRFFWFSSGISGIGDYIDDIAFAMLIYMVTESTLITSYVFAIKIILSFLSIATSAVTDYLNKKMILIITSFGQGILLLLLLLLYRTSHLSTAVLILFVTVQTIFSTFSVPAQNALIPLIISDDEIMVARASTGLVQQFIRVFSYLGAGVLIRSLGVLGAITLDAITFFLAGVFICFVKYTELNKIKKKQFFLKHSLKEGLAVIYHNKVILALILVTFLGNFFTSPIDSLAVVYFENFFSGESIFSVFMAMVALGGLIGTYIIVHIKNLKRMNMVFAFGFIIGGIGLCSLYYKSSLILPVAAGGLYGLSNGIISVLNGVILQQNTPKEAMGRVFSVFRNLTFVSGPVGVVFAGYLGELIGLNIIFLMMGIGLCITAWIAYQYTKTIP